jgi:alpha-tubulin suppressor-like RCC1 family protein
VSTVYRLAVTDVNEAPTSSVVISGTPIKGNTLTATNNLGDADVIGPIVYQWRANGIPIIGATANSLLLTGAHVGKTISVTTFYTDRAGTKESVSTALVASMPTPQASPGRSGGEYKNSGAFAALKDDGSVITWGLSFYGGDSSGVDLSGGVNQIFSTNYAFAALKDDGSVITWGHSSYGGDSSGVDLRSGVRQIFSTPYAFAALKDDGSVVSWGFRSYGGNSSGVDFSSGVSQIFSTNAAFAALKNDGSVVTWGDSHVGGNSSGVDFSSGVKQIFSTTYAFAALKTNGSVVSWGLSFYGGNSSGVADRLSSGVSQIFSTSYAFAALKDNGSVVTWGSSNYGGNSSSVADRLSSGVTQIFSTTYAFAALKENGSVVTWGDKAYGGNSSGVADRLSSGVSQIFSNTYAFAALKADGSVVSWGNSSYGGDSSLVAGLNSGVRQIFSTNGAFAALKADGSVITWGNNRYGGNSSGVAGLSSGVVQIFSTDSAFAAIKDDGSVITWGNNLYGGNSNGVAGLRSRVVAMANPFTDDDLLFVQQSSSVQPNNLQRSSLPTIPSGDSSLTRTFAAADASPYTVIPVMIQDSFDTGVAPTQTVTIASVRENTAPIEVVVAEGRRTHDTSPTITGTLSTPLGEGESLWLTNGSTLLVDGVVDNAARTWSATLALTTDGTYTITARVVDAAGSTVALSASRSFHLDTTAPRQTVAISAINANTGTITGPLANGAITNDTTPSLTGTLSGALATAEVLRIYSNGAFVGHGVVSGTNWSYTLATPLSANGSTVFTAQVIDAAGNSGPLSEPRSIVLDAPISSAAQDTLIGTVGAADIYRLPQLSLSLLGPAAALTYDTITNFEASDHLQVGGRSYRSWLTTSSGTAAGLDPSQLAAVLPAAWSANSARAFKVSGFDGTFVALNDGLAGFQSDQDAILFFSSYNPSANTPIVIL